MHTIAKFLMRPLVDAAALGWTLHQLPGRTVGRWRGRSLRVPFGYLAGIAAHYYRFGTQCWVLGQVVSISYFG
jgi:hypothetical protein